MMKSKIKKIIAFLLLLVICFSLFIFPVHATDSIKSKYYNTVYTSANVHSGVLEISNSYTVTSSNFTNAEIHTYVERKSFGLIWTRVNIGQPDNVWIDTSSSKTYVKNYYLSLSQTGTYRVTAEYRFYGSNGSESITKQQTVTY